MKFDQQALEKSINESLPSRERGLKFLDLDDLILGDCVAPLAGARIEIQSWKEGIDMPMVAPLAGARIEIVIVQT